MAFIVGQGVEVFCAGKIGRELTVPQGSCRIPPKEAEERKLPATSMEEPHYIFQSKTPPPLGQEMSGNR
jgi:hypothetical protein